MGHLERKIELYQNSNNLFPVEINPQSEKKSAKFTKKLKMKFKMKTG